MRSYTTGHIRPTIFGTGYTERLSAGTDLRQTMPVSSFDTIEVETAHGVGRTNSGTSERAAWITGYATIPRLLALPSPPAIRADMLELERESEGLLAEITEMGY